MFLIRRKKEVIKSKKVKVKAVVEETIKDDDKNVESDDVVIPTKKIKREKEDKGYEKEEKSEILDKDKNMIILTDDSIWKKSDTTVEEKTREDEFEDYLEDLML